MLYRGGQRNPQGIYLEGIRRLDADVKPWVSARGWALSGFRYSAVMIFLPPLLFLQQNKLVTVACQVPALAPQSGA